MRRVFRHRSGGFTLMELMVVLALIAMIAMFAVPRIGKSVAKGKMTDAITKLAGMAAAVETNCAVRNTLQDAIDGVGAASGYNAAIPNVATCGVSRVTMTPLTGSTLPTLCIKKVGNNWRYGYVLAAGAAPDSANDIPVAPDQITQGCQ